MPTKKTIQIEFPTNTDGELTHQIGNFGEDLWHQIERTKLGDLGGISEVDRAIDCLTIQVLHSRKVGTVRKLVDKILREHFLDGRSKITYL